jgi:hypothetical protein
MNTLKLEHILYSTITLYWCRATNKRKIVINWVLLLDLKRRSPLTTEEYLEKYLFPVESTSSQRINGLFCFLNWGILLFYSDGKHLCINHKNRTISVEKEGLISYQRNGRNCILLIRDAVGTTKAKIEYRVSLRKERILDDPNTYFPSLYDIGLYIEEATYTKDAFDLRVEGWAPDLGNTRPCSGPSSPC